MASRAAALPARSAAMASSSRRITLRGCLSGLSASREPEAGETISQRRVASSGAGSGHRYARTRAASAHGIRSRAADPRCRRRVRARQRCRRSPRPHAACIQSAHLRKRSGGTEIHERPRCPGHPVGPAQLARRKKPFTRRGIQPKRTGRVFQTPRESAPARARHEPARPGARPSYRVSIHGSACSSCSTSLQPPHSLAARGGQEHRRRGRASAVARVTVDEEPGGLPRPAPGQRLARARQRRVQRVDHLPGVGDQRGCAARPGERRQT